MAEQPEYKRHLRVDGFSDPQNFRSRKRGSSPPVPLRNRTQHGTELTRQYQSVLESSQAKRSEVAQPISESMGIYVQLISFEDCELPLNSLDTSDFELRSCRRINNRDVAIVFIPDVKRNAFQKKLNAYLDPERDGRNSPRNHTLIGSIQAVRLAEIRSFWTDAQNLFPQNNQQQVWWELWIKKTTTSEDQSPISIVQQLAERLNLRYENTYQVFFDSVVTLIYASVDQLQNATELISTLDELRSVRTTPNFFIESYPKEQSTWVRDLLSRLTVRNDSNVSVVILDNGVNFNHPILSQVTNANLSARWNPQWPEYNDYSQYRYLGWDHASRQAGIASFINLMPAVLSTNHVEIPYQIESGRILPAVGINDPKLYGAITTGVISKLEADRSTWKRVFSLAVTADSPMMSGQPTSWSSEIDQFSSGASGDIQRLFVISTGNIRTELTNPDYWTETQLAEAEDPSQSWNALTVGAFTEFTTNDDPSFDGWSPLAISGDISPASRTSVNWRWRSQAPYKPDVVAEGGNRLLSPDGIRITDADVVSILTTSGHTSGQLFEVTGDTSAATASISGQAAILLSENPDYWPETIKALLVHSAQWTPQMWARYNQLLTTHSPKVSKETMLRSIGYGVPNLQRARYSANHALTLIAQNTIQPFTKEDETDAGSDPTLNEMCLYELPWPVEVLQSLDPKLEVKLRVTLSYFIEPNPGRRGYRQRFSYQSHGLRFEVIRPGQSLPNFTASINKLAAYEDYDGLEGDAEGWLLGTQLRTRGTIHSDIWTGTAQALADMNTIAVYPVGGWWKYRRASDKWKNSVRFCLIVSIDVPNTDVDIYSSVATIISTDIEV